MFNVVAFEKPTVTGVSFLFLPLQWLGLEVQTPHMSVLLISLKTMIFKLETLLVSAVNISIALAPLDHQPDGVSHSRQMTLFFRPQ